MENKKKAVVYPFTREFLPYVSYLHSSHPDFTITSLVSPKGYFMDGKDAGHFDNRGAIGIPVTEDIDSALRDTQALVIPDSPVCSRMRTTILNQIKSALKMGHSVYCAMQLEEAEISELSSMSEKGEFIYLNLPENDIASRWRSDKIEEFDIPVVFIGEVMEDNQAADLLFSLTALFQKEGYQVSAVSPDANIRLSGLHSYPLSFSSSASDEDKVVFFNQYVHSIAENEHPDIILIQLAGGMIKYNNAHLNGMGIGAYLVSQAVQADGVIVSITSDMTNTDLFEELRVLFKHRFGTEMIAIHLSNRAVDAANQLTSVGKTEYCCYPQSYVNQLIAELCTGSKIPVYNIFSPGEIGRLYESVISYLAGNTIVY